MRTHIVVNPRVLRLAITCACLVLAVPVSSASTFKAEKLMVWSRGTGDTQVLDISSFVVGPDDSVYVATQGRVKRFSSEGELMLVTQPRLKNIVAFAVDSKGCIYVIHGVMQGLISKFDAHGALLSDDPTEAEGRGGLGSERLAFGTDGSLVNGEEMSFADRVAVACAKHKIALTFRGLTFDGKDRLHVLVSFSDSGTLGSAVFDTEGSLLEIGAGALNPIRFDDAGSRYVFTSVGERSQAAALLMYDPTETILPGPAQLPADPVVLSGVWTKEGIAVASPPLHGWTVDGGGSIYCYGIHAKDTPLALDERRSICSELIVYKMDSAGHILAQSPPLPASPDESDRYEPQVDARGRVYYLEFLADRTEVMRGAFTP